VWPLKEYPGEVPSEILHKLPDVASNWSVFDRPLSIDPILAIYLGKEDNDDISWPDRMNNRCYRYYVGVAKWE
jgi:hypothetical protein